MGEMSSGGDIGGSMGTLSTDQATAPGGSPQPHSIQLDRSRNNSPSTGATSAPSQNGVSNNVSPDHQETGAELAGGSPQNRPVGGSTDSTQSPAHSHDNDVRESDLSDESSASESESEKQG